MTKDTVYLHILLDGRESATLELPAQSVVTYDDDPGERFINISVDTQVLATILAHALPVPREPDGL